MKSPRCLAITAAAHCHPLPLHPPMRSSGGGRHGIRRIRLGHSPAISCPSHEGRARLAGTRGGIPWRAMHGGISAGLRAAAALGSCARTASNTGAHVEVGNIADGSSTLAEASLRVRELVVSTKSQGAGAYKIQEDYISMCSGLVTALEEVEVHLTGIAEGLSPLLQCSQLRPVCACFEQPAELMDGALRWVDADSASTPKGQGLCSSSPTGP